MSVSYFNEHKSKTYVKIFNNFIYIKPLVQQLKHLYVKHILMKTRLLELFFLNHFI